MLCGVRRRSHPDDGETLKSGILEREQELVSVGLPVHLCIADVKLLFQEQRMILAGCHRVAIVDQKNNAAFRLIGIAEYLKRYGD